MFEIAFKFPTFEMMEQELHVYVAELMHILRGYACGM